MQNNKSKTTTIKRCGIKTVGTESMCSVVDDNSTNSTNVVDVNKKPQK
jgi:hypothetical protein